MNPIILTSDNFIQYARNAKPGDLLLVQFGRKDVEACNIASALDRLMCLSDSPEFVRKFADSMVLMFTGYDDDPRELYAIPECRRFMRKLTQEWAFWYHFMKKDNPTFSLLFKLLCDVDEVSRNGRQIGICFRDFGQVKRQVLALFDAMNILYDANGYSEEENVHMLDKVNQAIEAMFACRL